MLQTVYRSDRVCSLEHVAAAHEHVGTCSHEQRSRLVVYAAVYLYESLAARLIDEAAQALRLLYRVGYELLSAEARVDAHQQHHVHVADDVLAVP